MKPDNSLPRLRVCAVSYLNTVPLVWGMLHGEQRGLFDLLFRVPAECAEMVAAGAADIGIIPSFALLGHELDVIPNVGIACRGAVRSILLVSSKPAAQIRTIAADSSSRTSVALMRIILERRYGVQAAVVTRSPNLAAMLAEADGALIIGDPALRLGQETASFHTYDLGQEWMELTGLPMVFAVWAGPRQVITPEVAAAFQASCDFGLRDLDRIVAAEASARSFAPGLVREYLTSHIVFQLGPAERAGMELFLEYAREVERPAVMQLSGEET